MPLAARTLVLALALMAATCGQKGPLTPPAHSGLAPEVQMSTPPAMTPVRPSSSAGIEAARGA